MPEMKDYLCVHADVVRGPTRGGGVMVKLPDPKPGHEWVQMQKHEDGLRGEVSFTYRLFPLRKRYDWGKTARHVIVLCNETRNQISLGQAVEPCRLVTMLWQAHIGGDPCPVDPDATMVEIRGGEQTYPAAECDWEYDCIYRVVGLAEGYGYERG